MRHIKLHICVGKKRLSVPVAFECEGVGVGVEMVAEDFPEKSAAEDEAFRIAGLEEVGGAFEFFVGESGAAGFDLVRVVGEMDVPNGNRILFFLHDVGVVLYHAFLMFARDGV